MADRRYAQAAARDAQTSGLALTIVAALTLLAHRLAVGEITADQFVAHAADTLAQTYVQAMDAGAAQAGADFGLLSADADWSDTARSRADEAKDWLGALAGIVVATGASAAAGQVFGPNGDQLSPEQAVDQSLGGRISMYGSTTTGAWEDAYTQTIADTVPNPRFVWVTSGDDSVCDSCQALDGQEFDLSDLGALPGDADFGAGTDGCDGGPNCRCWLELVDAPADQLTDAVAASGKETDMKPSTIEKAQQALAAAQITANAPQTAGTPTTPGTTTVASPPPGLTAAGGDGMGPAFHAWGIREGERSSDKRQIQPGALTVSELPLPWMFQPTSGHGGMPGPAVIAGRVDLCELRDGVWYVEGFFTDDEAGQAAADAAKNQTCRFVSGDIYEQESQIVITQQIDPYEDFDDGDITDIYELVTTGVIRGFTQLAFAAFPSCVVTLADEPLPDIAAPTVALVASGFPVAPPADWFADPALDGPTPLTVTDDGRVFGHVATWGAQHVGYPDKKLNPPRSRTNYAHYLTGELKTAEGSTVAVGQIVMGCGHAGPNLSAQATAAFYDGGPGAVQMADVHAGEDAHGIWVAGALRPTVTDEQVREFRALAPSGDWRRVGGNLELVSVLQVPTPGFATSRLVASAEVIDISTRAGMRDQEMVSLVAAGRLTRTDSVLSRIVAVERELGVYRAMFEAKAREDLRSRLTA